MKAKDTYIKVFKANMITPPCKNCLLVPICRCKYYEDIVFSCKLFSNFLSYRAIGEEIDRFPDDNDDSKCITEIRKIHNKRVKEIYCILNPDKWELDHTDLKETSGWGYILKLPKDKEHAFLHWRYTAL
jgi:hypothetical protein